MQRFSNPETGQRKTFPLIDGVRAESSVSLYGGREHKKDIGPMTWYGMQSFPDLK